MRVLQTLHDYLWFRKISLSGAALGESLTTVQCYTLHQVNGRCLCCGAVHRQTGKRHLRV